MAGHNKPREPCKEFCGEMLENEPGSEQLPQLRSIAGAGSFAFRAKPRRLRRDGPEILIAGPDACKRVAMHPVLLDEVILDAHVAGGVDHGFPVDAAVSNLGEVG